VFGSPHEQFDIPFVRGRYRWDVTRDGQQFITLVPVETRSTDPLTVILNWRPQAGSR
jgi:hypothetical protein